jgi:tetratricopeptide (TPR) repeat protein
MDEVRRLLDEVVSASNASKDVGLQITTALLQADVARETGNGEDDVQHPLAEVRAKIDQGGLGNPALVASSADMIEGESRLMRHDANGALPLLQRALAAREKLLVPPSLRLAEAQTQLGLCYLELGQLAQAKELAASAAAIESHYAQLGEHYRQPLHELQVRLQSATKPLTARAVTHAPA